MEQILLEKGYTYRVLNKRTKNKANLTYAHNGELVLCIIDKNQRYREKPTTEDKVMKNFIILNKLE